MAEVIQNTFAELNTDISDYLLGPTMMRMSKNVRVVDLNSSTFALTNIKGTEQIFSLSTGFLPIAVQSYNEVMYILSYNPANPTYEMGSYPSPDYENQAIGVPAGNSNDYLFYRPINVFETANEAPYSTGVWDKRFTFDGTGNTWSYNLASNVSMEIQPEYDGSVNIVITGEGKPPRIVNSGFEKNANDQLIILEPRSAQANSNTYTLDSLDKETKLILRSEKILKISYNNITGGGRLLHGNYHYLFAYQTEDFSTTDIVGESSICQIYDGETLANIKGGDQDTATTRKVVLNLDNVDTDFQYVKAYFKYSSGTDIETEAWFELDRPIEITGTSMEFVHTGFEDSTEVAFDDLNVEDTVIESANASTQIAGYLLLGGIKGPTFDYDTYTAAAQKINHTIQSRNIPYSGGIGRQGYDIQSNVYNYLGYMGGETYPFGIRFIMKDGSLSPVFPVKGYDHHLAIGPGDDLEGKGLIRFPQLVEGGGRSAPFFDDASEQIKARHPQFDMTTFLAQHQDIVDETLGFFFVRGERREDVIAQGLMLPAQSVPPIKYQRETTDSTYYKDNRNGTADIWGVSSEFRFVPVIDCMNEAYGRQYEGTNPPDKYVISDVDGTLSSGYMPVNVLDPGSPYSNFNNGYGAAGSANVQMFPQTRWTFFPGESLVDLPTYVTTLQRDNVYIRQIYKQNHRVKGLLENKYQSDPFTATNTGIFYDFEGYASQYAYTATVPIDRIHFAPEETFATGTPFISKVDFEHSFVSGYQEYKINSVFPAYFGFEMSTAPFDSIPALTNPIGANFRYCTTSWWNGVALETTGTHIENYNQLVPASFLVNVYPQDGPNDDVNNIYSNVESVVYRQVGPRYAWDDLAPLSNLIPIYGGDCYISKAHLRLNRSPYDEAGIPLERPNINQGILVSWLQESKHNLSLRSVYDAGESGDRDFYPRYNADPIEYRNNRLKESNRYSRGFSETQRTKTGSKIDDATVFVRSDLYSRVVHSAKHVPNTFKNGYREFSGNNYQDYDVELGKIVKLSNYRNILHVIFEHGVGVGEINQRIQTGSDISGAIFVQPDQVLPPTLGFYSKDIGTQHPRSVVRAPSGLYGVDREKKKIWRIRDNMEIISDESVASWLESVSFNDPISGYNPKHNEIVFTSSDGWTLCYHEGLGKFVSFYTYVPDFYSTIGRDMVSLVGSAGHKHDVDTTMDIYGNLEDCYVEFVVNVNPNITKVFDFINIISNEVTPQKVEYFTYTEDNKHQDTLITAGMGQYSQVLDDQHPLSGHDNIRFRDKKFVVQVPNSEIYNSLLDNWAIEGRMRNKYLIIRLTYNTSKRLQLLSVITTYRNSYS